jgi:hypothetical protein
MWEELTVRTDEEFFRAFTTKNSEIPRVFSEKPFPKGSKISNLVNRGCLDIKWNGPILSVHLQRTLSDFLATDYRHSFTGYGLKTRNITVFNARNIPLEETDECFQAIQEARGREFISYCP